MTLAPIGVVVRPGGTLEEGLTPADVARAIREPGTRSWLDLEQLEPADAELLERAFGFHPLAIEDAQSPDTWPTVEEYVVSGYFGMNFERMPWVKQPWGVAAATALMIAVSVGLLGLFRWRRWL